MTDLLGVLAVILGAIVWGAAGLGIWKIYVWIAPRWRTAVMVVVLIAVCSAMGPWLFVIGVLAWFLGRWVGRAVYQRTGERWKQALATTMVLWLPFWDLVPGTVFFYHAVYKYGGVRIYERVKAEGYLELACTFYCERRWVGLAKDPYQYIEVHIPQPEASRGHIPARVLPLFLPGYYQFFTMQITPQQCLAEQQLPDRRSHYVTDEFKLRHPPESALRDICVVAQRHDRSISRYRHEYAFREKLPDYPSWLPVWSGWSKLVDSKTDRVITQSYSPTFFSWFYPTLSRNFNLVWDYPPLGSNHQRLEISEVIQPLNVKVEE
jgi:hypothetical protein